MSEFRLSTPILGIAHGDLISQVRVAEKNYFIKGDLTVINGTIYQVLGTDIYETGDDVLIIIKDEEIKEGDTVNHWRNPYYGKNH